LNLGLVVLARVIDGDSFWLVVFGRSVLDQWISVRGGNKGEVAGRVLIGYEGFVG